MAEEAQKKSRGRPKTMDRMRTLKVAMESYWDEGVHSISLNEICRRADVSKPSLYREFGGEDELMLAVLEHYIETVFSSMVELIESDRPFAGVLHDLVHAVTGQRDTPAGCMVVKMGATSSELGPLTAARLKQFRQEYLLVYEGWVKRAQGRKEINLEIPVKLAASYLDSQLSMILTQMATGEEPSLVRAKAELAFRPLIHL